MCVCVCVRARVCGTVRGTVRACVCESQCAFVQRANAVQRVHDIVCRSVLIEFKPRFDLAFSGRTCRLRRSDAWSTCVPTRAALRETMILFLGRDHR